MSDGNVRRLGVIPVLSSFESFLFCSLNLSKCHPSLAPLAAFAFLEKQGVKRAECLIAVRRVTVLSKETKEHGLITTI